MDTINISYLHNTDAYRSQTVKHTGSRAVEHGFTQKDRSTKVPSKLKKAPPSMKWDLLPIRPSEQTRLGLYLGLH